MSSLSRPDLTQPGLTPGLTKLGLTRPLVLAPMAGGVSTPALVAAVSEAGGLGSLGAAYLSAPQIKAAGDTIRQLTPRAFAINLFAPQPLPDISAPQISAAVAELAPLHAALQIAPPPFLGPCQEDFAAQMQAVLELRPAAFSFAFGRIPPALIAEFKRRGTLTIGTATSVTEAKLLELDGVDAVVMQGGAAGGHRGGWAQDDFAGTLELVRAAVSAMNLPVIAAGGLMSRGAVAAALSAGAALAQCGTAFLRATEAGTSAAYRQALAQAKAGETTLTRSFSGRPARGLKNTVTENLSRPLPYPYQNALTRPLRSAAASQGRADYLSLWAGEGVWQGWDGSAAEIVAALSPELVPDPAAHKPD